MKSIDELAADLNFTTAKTGDGPLGHLPARAARAARRYTVISVDDHIVEPPDTFDGRAAAQVRRPRAEGRRHRRRRPDLDLRRPVTAERRLQRGRRPAGVRVRLRAGPLRRNAPRRMGYPRARQGHGPQRRLRVAELPVVPAGFRRPAAAAGDQRPRPGAGLGAGLERLAPRRVGRRRTPTGSFPCQLPWLLDPELGAKMIRENAERGFHAVTFSENPAMLGTAEHSLRPLGPDDGGLRRDRHRGEPAHRLVGHRRRRPPTTRRRTCRACCSSPTPSPPRSTGCTPGLPSRFPDLKICLSEGGIGWVAGLLDRLDHMLSYHEMYGTWAALGETPDAGRGAHAQLLVLRGRGPVVVHPARPDRRRQHHARSRLPALRLDVAAHPDARSTSRSATCPPTSSESSRWENASRLYQHPVPAEVQRDPEAF